MASSVLDYTVRRKREHHMAPADAESFTITVPTELRTYFRSLSIQGHGGFQSLGRLLCDRLSESDDLTLTMADLRRIVHYARAYGNGGFQTRLRELVVEYVAQHVISHD